VALNFLSEMKFIRQARKQLCWHLGNGRSLEVKALALSNLGMKIIRQAGKQFCCHLGNGRSLEINY